MAQPIEGTPLSLARSDSMTTFSGYLSIFNDYDLLPKTLESIRGLVSELVVVDGGYTWMESYLQANGKSLERSCDEVYSALDASGIKYRTINRVWKNEIEKRIAGYAACETDYVFRIDADEITFANASEIEAFAANRSAVAEMDLPIYDSPGRVQGKPDAERYPRQGFLFDRNQISAEDHLHYLWLVLTADQLNKSDFTRRPYHPKPVAFNAHLSNWRTPTGGSQRAAFYVLNYMRQHGAPGWTDLPAGPLVDFKPFFDVLPPAIFQDAMSRSQVINNQFVLDGGALLKSPLRPEDEEKFVELYDNFNKAAQAHTEKARHVEQGFIAGQTLCFQRSLDTLGKAGTLRLEFSSDIASANGKCHSVVDADPFRLSNDAVIEISKNILSVKFPAVAAPSSTFVRQVLALHVWPKPPNQFGHFKVASEAGSF